MTNTGSADSPNLENGTISDTLTGNLLDPANTAVTSSTCTATLATGACCTITTTRTVLDSDPNPLVNTVTVHYNPVGFPNDITDTATDQVVIVTPRAVKAARPGSGRVPQHYDSWTGFTPGQSLRRGVRRGRNARWLRQRPTLTNPTLLEALKAGGGGQNALARHAVAALLNASSPDVDFDFTTAEVIAMVQDAVASGDFDDGEESPGGGERAGCPLS